MEEYAKEFEGICFMVTMHNPGYDDLFFGSHFVKGLKDELRGMVESQVPETVERACLLAKVHNQVLEKAKTKIGKTTQPARSNTFPSKPDQKATAPTSGLWKERQLQDFHRANNLCYFCGEKFDAEHLGKCSKCPKPQLNALALNDLDVQLIESTLNQLEIEDVLTQELCQLSINAMAGTESADSMRVRALVHNQVMLILIDFGSSHSFINSALVQRLDVKPVLMAPVSVQLADGGTLVADKFIPNLQRWAQGSTFTSTMRFLDIGAYDAILGYDWLKAHSPMLCDWEAKSMQFVEQGVHVKLCGVSQSDSAIKVLSADQLINGAQVMRYGHLLWYNLLMILQIVMFLLSLHCY